MGGAYIGPCLGVNAERIMSDNGSAYRSHDFRNLLAKAGLRVAVVEAAGLDFRHMIFVNPYLTADIPMRIMNQQYAQRFEFGNTPARATIEVASLPGGAPDGTGRHRHRLRDRRPISA